MDYRYYILLILSTFFVQAWGQRTGQPYIHEWLNNTSGNLVFEPANAWQPSAVSSGFCAENQARMTLAEGASVSLDFVGDFIRVVFVVFEQGARFSFALDGLIIQTRDTYEKGTQLTCNVITWTDTNVTPGRHRVTVTKLAANSSVVGQSALLLWALEYYAVDPATLPTSASPAPSSTSMQLISGSGSASMSAASVSNTSEPGAAAAKSSQTGIIVGSVLGVIAILLAGVAGFLFLRKRPGKQKAPPPANYPNQPSGNNSAWAQWPQQPGQQLPPGQPPAGAWNANSGFGAVLYPPEMATPSASSRTSAPARPQIQTSLPGQSQTSASLLPSSNRPLPSPESSGGSPTSGPNANNSRLSPEQIDLLNRMIDRNVPGESIGVLVDSMVGNYPRTRDGEDRPVAASAGTQLAAGPPPIYDFKEGQQRPPTTLPL